MLQLCRVVLVGTHYPGNLGAVARIMCNFGLNDLVLVAPRVDPLDPQAKQLSTRGEDILHQARIVPTLGEAVSDCVLVVGTSGRAGGLMRRQSFGPPQDILPHLAHVFQQGRRGALVFGPEPNGLINEEITQCHYMVQVPTAPHYPALNLGQATAICLYELFQTCQGLEPSSQSLESIHELAEVAAQERMFDHLRLALEEIHFLFGDKAESLMHAVRHLLGKARLTTMEVKLLEGLARQIRWHGG